MIVKVLKSSGVYVTVKLYLPQFVLLNWWLKSSVNCILILYLYNWPVFLAH